MVTPSIIMRVQELLLLSGSNNGSVLKAYVESLFGWEIQTDDSSDKSPKLFFMVLITNLLNREGLLLSKERSFARMAEKIECASSLRYRMS